MVEGIAAMALAFLLLATVAQAATAVVAVGSARAAAADAARRAARHEADSNSLAADLERAITATIPGVEDVTARVSGDGRVARAQAAMMWRPPGPGWSLLRITVSAAVPEATPP